MNKPKKLRQSGYFLSALTTPILVGLTLFFVAFHHNTNLELCLTSNCINYFFELYKYPLAVIGLSVPLTAIAAALHRSDEASHQIDETLKQNIFNNYIKHKEDFFGLLDKLEISCECKFLNPLELYKKLFPNNNYSSLNYVAHIKVSKGETSKNHFLDELNSGIFNAKATMYAPNADEDVLISNLLEIHELTNRLYVKRSDKTSSESPNNTLVWPNDFARTSTTYLYTISQTLSAFAFHKHNKTEHRSRYVSNFRLPNNANTLQTNTKLINEIALGIVGEV